MALRTPAVGALAPALLLLYVVVGLATLTTFPLVWSDEGWYVQSAWSFVENGSFALPMFVDFAGFDADNTVYGRLYLGALATAFAIGEASPYVARLVSFLSGIVAIVALFGVGRELWSERVGLIAALMLAVSPVFIDQSHDARPEIMQVAVTFVAFYLMLLGERRRSALLLVVAGFVASLAADVHFNGLVVPGALLLALVVRRPGRRTVGLFFLGTALGGLWWLAAHVVPDPERFIEQTRAWGYPAPIATILERPAFEVGMEVARYLRVDAGSLAMLLGLVAGAWLLRRHRDRALLSLLTYAGVTLLFMFLAVGNKQPIYAVLLWPVLALLVARLADVIDRRRAVALIGGLIVISLLSVGSMFMRDRDADYEGYIAQIQAAIPDDAVVMGQPSAWFGFADQPYVASQYFVYVGPFEDEMRRLGVEYVIADEYLDLQLHHLEELPADEVATFLRDHGEVVAEITDPFYGRLQSGGEPPFITRVYRIDQAGR